MYSGLNSARDSARVGAGVAIEKSSELMSSAGTVTKDGLDFAAEKSKQGAETIYNAGVGAKTALLDDTGSTDGAVAAGGYVYEKSAQGLTTAKTKLIDDTGIADGAAAASGYVYE